MREDLNKLLCERERPRSGDHYHFYRHDKRFEQLYRDDDSYEEFYGVASGHRESMKRRHNTKSFNENLNPLWGFIHKSVGRPWDSVYSEICQVFDKRSVINQHILIHLFQRVDTDVKIVDGQLGTYNSHWGFIPLKESFVDYYVDPRDGILKYNHQRLTYRQSQRIRAQRRAEEEKQVRRVINDLVELHKINDSWFLVSFVHNKGEPVTKAMVFGNKKPYLVTSVAYPFVYDVLKKTTSSDKKVAISKRQLSHKELKQYGLI